MIRVYGIMFYNIMHCRVGPYELTTNCGISILNLQEKNSVEFKFRHFAYGKSAYFQFRVTSDFYNSFNDSI